MKKRIEILDNAKGIGIILLIYGHLFTYGSPLFKIIFAFHMPLFFFISGLFLDAHRKNGKKLLIYKYLLPYIFFEFGIGSIVLLLISYFKGIPILVLYRRMATDIFIYIGSDTAMVGSIWFLGVLSLSLIASRWLILMENKVLNKWKGSASNYRATIIISLSLIAIVMTQIPHGILPLRLSTIPGVTAIIFTSNMYGVYLIELAKKCNWKLPIVLTIILVIFSLINKTVNVSIPVYGDYFIYLICAISGIFITFFISNKFTSVH